VLIAGALLPPEAEVPDRRRVDDVSARSYAHQGLPHPIVRFCGDGLAPGEDLVMDLLGFEDPEVTGPVGVRRRATLGFPGWALIHDPKHARYALDVYRDFKKAARRVATKPGAAVDEFKALSRPLDRSVPHFLPTYYEEVGRVFLEAENTTYAAQFFGKAREAERVHALSVDEARLADVFLEFALAGALTAKELSAYGKALAERRDPATAWTHLRELYVKRSRGGMPPFAAMRADAKRLCKAGGLDYEQEERQLVLELLGTPGLKRAPKSFWTSFTPTVKALCSESATARRQLLELLPQDPDPWGDSDHNTTWIALLDECGALAVLAQPKDAEPDAQPSMGAAGWFDQVLTWASGWRSRIPDRLFSLLRESADRLVADGTPLAKLSEDADLLDLALELGIPVADPNEETDIDLSEWCQTEPGPDRPRELSHLAKDPRFTEKLLESLDDAMSVDEFERVAGGRDGLLELRRQWVERRVARLEQAPLAVAARAVDELRNCTQRETFVDFPEHHARLASVDFASALAKTLRIGLPGELGWPPLEAALAELQPSEKVDLHVAGGFPILIVATKAKAIVLGPHERLLEHDIRLPKKAQDLRALHYAGGQLLVMFQTDGWDTKAYWSGSPGDVFDVKGWHNMQLAEASAVLEDGGVSHGGRALYPGDTQGPDATYELCSDGDTWWRLQSSPPDYEHKWVEVDPRTGKTGRNSLPAWHEQWTGEERKLEIYELSLLPVPEGAPQSPLGQADGKYGWRVRVDMPKKSQWDDNGSEPQGFECESIDGRRFEGKLVDDLRPRALLRLPGADTERLLGEQDVCDTEGNAGWDHSRTPPKRGDTRRLDTPWSLPLVFWNFFTPRDEAGSRSLRTISDETAAALLECAQAERNEDRKTDFSKTQALVAAQLPEVTDARLVAAITEAVATTADVASELSSHLDKRDPSKAPAISSRGNVPTEHFNALVDQLVDRGYGSDGTIDAQMRTVAAFFDSGQAPDEVPEGDVNWEELVGSAGAIALRAVSPAFEDKPRAAGLEYLRAYATTSFAETKPGSYRALSLEWDEIPEYLDLPRDDEDDIEDACSCHEEGGNRYFLRTESVMMEYFDDDDTFDAQGFEYAPDGEFKPLHGAKVESSTVLGGGWGGRERIEAFVAEAAQRGPLPVDPAVVQALAERADIPVAEAALIWLGMPGFGDWNNNFLNKDVRTALGLKVADLGAARDALKELSTAKRAKLLDAAIPDDPATLWTSPAEGEGNAVDRIAARLREVAGKRVKLPPELVTAIEKELNPDLDARQLLQSVVDPDSSEPFNNDGRWKFDEDGDLTQDRDSDCFDTEHLTAVAQIVPWLSMKLPAGDPLRANVPKLVDKVRQRLSNPELLLDLDISLYDDNGDRAMKTAELLLERIGGDPFTIPKNDKLQARDAGPLVAVLKPDSDWDPITVSLRPAKIADDADIKRAEELRRSAGTEPYGIDPLEALVTLRSDGFSALLDRLENSPLDEGQHEANPLHSAPELVAKLQKAEDLSEDAAVLYLQTLALAAPTRKSVMAWNDWKPARYKKACAELESKKLLLQAKRARAGRDYFLPGGWESSFSAPDLPLETWKFELYGIERKDKDGGIHVPLERVLPLAPVHALFTKAWERVSSGDRPSYDEVKR